MKIVFNRLFLKDLSTLPDRQRRKIETFVFDNPEKFEKITGSRILHKLKGFKNYYRIRFGDYRVGVSIRNDTITFERVLHRREIYKYFP